MKLVDIDEFELIHYEPQNDLAYALGWNDCVDTIKEKLSTMQEVKAITIEWLNQKYAENDPNTHEEDYDYFLWDAIAYILTLWKEEQESEDSALN